MYCIDCDIYTFHLPCPCAGVAVIDRGRVLLVQRGNPPNKGKWATPGGVVEHGESPRKAAARELKEETGVSASSSSLVLASTVSSTETSSDVSFNTTSLRVTFVVPSAATTGEPNSGPEVEDVRYWEIDEIEDSREAITSSEKTRIRQSIRVVNE